MRRSVRSSIHLFLALACVPNASVPTDSARPHGPLGSEPSTVVVDPTTSDTGDTSQATTSPDTGARPPLTITQQPVVCADPSARERLGAFERRFAPGPGLADAGLVGGAIVAADLTGDDRVDLFVPHADGTAQLWAQSAEGGFDDVGPAWFGGLDLVDATAATAVDVDGDGDLDLFVARWARPHRLLRNDGDRFVDITAASGLGDTAWRSQATAWGDLDRDGDLDLVVGNHGDVPATHDDPAMPPADPAELYRNEGDGTFTDVGYLLPPELRDAHNSVVAFVDVDGDGWPELLSAHEYGLARSSVLLANHGGTLEVDPDSGFHPGFASMGLGIGDMNGDGHPDLLQSSWRMLSLLQSLPAAGGVGARWIEFAPALGLQPDIGPSGRCFGALEAAQHQCYGWGAELADVDNDADLDAAVVFGFWSTYPSTRRHQRDGLWVQDADGQFVDQADALGFADAGSGRGLVAADINGDGWVDLVKRELEGASPLYLSRCGDAGWLRVRPRDRGPNTMAVGARVTVEVDGAEQSRWILAGGHGLYGSGPPVAHFGLGASDVVDALRVRWSDGTVDRLEGPIAARQVLTLQRN
jgi:hypothetical protein